MKTNQEIRDYLAEQKRWYKLMDGADPEFRLVEGIIEGLEFVLDRKNEEPEPVLATRHNDNEVIDVTLTEDIAFEEGFEQGKLAQKKGDELPPADRDDKHYHEEQDHIAMVKHIFPKENK